MIRNEREYQYTLERIRDFKEQAEAMSQRLLEEGYTERDVEVGLAGISAILFDARLN